METADPNVSNIDKSQMPPLHQKRILAFVNHFLINSCSFLNEFAEKCEIKFIEVERKLQKVEAALTIIEAKLASIPDIEASPKSNAPDAEQNAVPTPLSNETETQISNEESTIVEEPMGVKACEDFRYKKYFKMLQVGVPATAVKLKIKVEGLDPEILDNPTMILPDGSKEAS